MSDYDPLLNDLVGHKHSGEEIEGGNVGGVVPVNSIQFDTTPTAVTPAEGLLQWNATDGTLNMGMSNGDVTLQVGQEQFIKVKNNTGSTLLNGKVIYIDNADGGRPTAVLANNESELMARKTIAILTKDIPDGEEGFGTTFGKIRGIDTSGYNLGEILYVSDVDGELTNTRPVNGKWIVNVGVVTIKDATVGEIFIRSIQYERPDEITLINGFPGFANSQNTISVSVVAGVGTFKIEPTSPATTFRYYQGGIQYLVTGEETLEITDVEGVHWFYYEGGVLKQSVNPTDGESDTLIRNTALIAQVYWDATNNNYLLLGNERHGFTMSSVTHSYLHFTQGAKWVSGMALNSVVTGGTGDLDAHAQFGVDSGVGTDEDLTRQPSAVDSTVGLPIFYLDGANANLRRVTKAGFSVYPNPTGTTNRLMYNEWTGAVWQLTEVTEGNFVLCHVFSTNDVAQPYVAFIGQNIYTLASSARTGASTEIASIVTSFPREEMIPLATLIYQTDKDYDNAVNARVIEVSSGVSYVDWRTTDIVASAIATPTDHNSLSGKQGGTIGEYYHLTSAEYTAAQAVPTTYLKLDASNDPITGDLKLTPTANSTTTSQIFKQDGTTNVFNVDTTNGIVSVGQVSPAAKLDVYMSGYNTTLASVIRATIDTSSANEPAIIAKNSTNFAHGGNIILAQMLNGTDSGNVVQIDNAGTGLSLLTNAGGVVFNESGNANGDFRIEGDTDTNLLFVDASADKIGIGTSAPTVGSLSFGGNEARVMGLERHTTADTAGNNLTVQAGGATSGATNKAGGALQLSAGISTGTGSSLVRFLGSTPAGSGTANNAVGTIGQIYKSSSTAYNLALNNTTSGATANGVSLYGNALANLIMYRHSTANTAGNILNVQAGGAASGATDKNGGDLYLKSAIATGTGTSAIRLFTATAGSTGTADRAPTEKMTLLGNGNLGIGTTTPTALVTIKGTAPNQLLVYTTDTDNSQQYSSLTAKAYANADGYWVPFFGFSNTGSNSARFGGGTSTANAATELLFYTAVNTTTATGTARMKIDSSGNVGIGTSTPGALLHVAGTNPIVRFEDDAADSAISRTMSGLELVSRTVTTGFQQLYAIKFMSSDGSLTTENPKFLGGILPRATELYTADTNGGMAIDFATSPNSPGATNVPLVRMTIDNDGNIGIGTTTPNANALLDISSTTKAFMPPRMTTAQRDAIASPTAGMVIYNSTTNVLNFHNGSAWGAV